VSDPINFSKPFGEMRDPVLVTGFAARQRGGRLARTALTSIAQAWQGELVLEINGDDFFDFTVRRPERLNRDQGVSIDWPTIQAFAARPDKATHDFLLLGGFEPHFRWATLVELITKYAETAGVGTLVSLRSFPGEVPHTRPAPVRLTASDIDTEVKFGVQAETSRYQGPADFGAVLAAQAELLGWKTVDLSVIVPYYFRPMPAAAATISLIRVLDQAFGTDTPTETLQTAAVKEAAAVDEGLAGNGEAQSMVRELERNYDEGLERAAFLSPGSEERTTLPSGEELVEDVERFFRDKGAPGGSING
jgi:hypothetical protein